MQNLIQEKPCRPAAQNNENDLQDFDSISELPAVAHTETFWGTRKCALGAFSLSQCRKPNYPRVPGGMSPGKILQNYTQIYAILVLFGTTFEVIFFSNLLAFVTATPKIYLFLAFLLIGYNVNATPVQQAFQKTHQLNFII